MDENQFITNSGIDSGQVSCPGGKCSLSLKSDMILMFDVKAKLIAWKRHRSKLHVVRPQRKSVYQQTTSGYRRPTKLSTFVSYQQI